MNSELIYTALTNSFNTLNWQSCTQDDCPKTPWLEFAVMQQNQWEGTRDLPSSLNSSDEFVQFQIFWKYKECCTNNHLCKKFKEETQQVLVAERTTGACGYMEVQGVSTYCHKTFRLGVHPCPSAPQTSLQSWMFIAMYSFESNTQ